MVARGMRGCRWGVCGCRGACVVAGGACVIARGCAWLPRGVHGCLGDVHGCGGVHAWLPGGVVCRIRRDTVNERAVRILLECILVYYCQPYMIMLCPLPGRSVIFSPTPVEE